MIFELHRAQACVASVRLSSSVTAPLRTEIFSSMISLLTQVNMAFKKKREEEMTIVTGHVIMTSFPVPSIHSSSGGGDLDLLRVPLTFTG